MEIFLFLIIFAFIGTAAYAGLRAAPWAPTKAYDVERFLKLAKIKKGEKVYDIGCGDGRMLFAAGKSGAKCIGFEISLFPYMLAKIRSFFRKNKNVKIRYRDFWNTDLSDADLVYFFLMPKIYPKLKRKLDKELKKGARVVCYVWPFEKWKPVKIDKQKKHLNLFLYKK